MTFSPSSQLRWLYVDLNCYFASVEQQLNKALRGKPIAVVPMKTDSTCAIAASREAKKYGVKTGTMIREAKRLCKDLILVEARHDCYVDFHHRIVQEIERHYPIHVIGSIDEVACRLDGRHAHEATACDLARRIKHGLRKNLGECITCSIGIAPNRYLAKTASDLTKPDGLEVIHLNDMPGRISHLKLNDLCGIGRNMEPRLYQAGIHTITALWHTPAPVLHRIWGGVGGERFWHQLHGGELDEEPVNHRTVGHSHVLAPQFRAPADAGVIARRLLLKAASRMRRMGYRAREMTVSLRAEHSQQRGEAHLRFAPVSDSHALLSFLVSLWERALEQTGRPRVLKISVTLHGLESIHTPEQLDLFPNLGCPIQAERERRDRLSQIMDQMNQTFGRDSIALGFTPDTARVFSGTKIAFTRIPDLREFQE